MQHGMNRFFAFPCNRSGFSHLAKLNLGHHAQHMILGLEVIEEGPFAHVRGFGDFFHRDIGETALGNKLQCAPE